MSTVLTRRLLRLRDRRGVVALEFLVCVPVFLVALALYANLWMYCANLSTATGLLNRLRNDVAAQSCLPSSEQASVEYSKGLLRADSLTVDARAEAIPANYLFNLAQLAYPDGTPRPLTAANFAYCSPLANPANGETTDVVPQLGYIWIHLSYKQHLILGPTLTVQRTVLAVSTSFRSGN